MKKRGGGAYRVSFLGGAWLASSAALSMLVFLLSGAIRLIDGGQINVDGGVHTSVSCLSLPSPLLSFPIFVPFFTSCIASGCAAASLGSSWCFFWHLLAWSPVFDSPRLRTGVWARMWLLRKALSSACVRGGIDWVWCVVWCVVVVGRKK